VVNHYVSFQLTFLQLKAETMRNHGLKARGSLFFSKQKSDEPKPIAFQNPKSKIRDPILYQQPYRLF